MAGAPHITVAVPVKDRRERMLRCLDSLLALNYPSYDVLVLDNGSSDGTGEACRERAANAPVPVRVEVVEGSVGRVRNVAARMAQGELIAYTDSDCMVDPGWLGTAARRFGDPRVGVVTGRTVPETEGPYERWPATIEVSEQTWRFESCNVLFRRAPFVSTAGFHEEIGHFWEDTAAGWAMLKAGWNAVFEPGAIVVHDVTYPGLRWYLSRGRKYGNAAAVIRRYPELRRELLWCRVFLRPRTAAVAFAVAGALLRPLLRRAPLATVPYLWIRLPRRATVAAARLSLEYVLFDLSILVGLIEGSLRWRTLVL